MSKTNQDQPSTHYDREKWMVHVYGPGSVLDAKSFSEAVEKCNLINTHLLEIAKTVRNELKPVYPLAWAVVEIWDSLVLGDHDPEETDWTEIF